MKKSLAFLSAFALIFGAMSLGGVPKASAMLYGTSGNGGTLSTLYSIDTDTGVTTEIGDVGYAVNGLESYNGVLYGTTSFNDPAFHGLITIDTASGAGSEVGTRWGGSITDDTLVEMAIDSAGNAYSWGSPFQNDLYSLNLGLGTGSLVGDSGLNTATIGLAFDSSDTLHLINGDGETFTINTGTGAAASLGFVGGDGDASHHGDTDVLTGLYWGLDNFPGLAGSTAINIIDLSTLETTPLALDGAPIHTLAFATTAPAPVPEPATMLLLGIGLIGLVGFRRKFRKA